MLVTGGVVDGGDECLGSNCLSTAEVYDAATGTWSSTGSFATARGFHSATLLSNGASQYTSEVFTQAGLP